MSEPTTPFEDPALKRALSGLAANHTAPVSLRDRVARAMAAEPVEAVVAADPLATHAPITPLSARRSLLMKIAAVLLIGIGGGGIAYELYDGTARPAASNSASNGASGYAVPGLWKAMVAVQESHDVGATSLPPGNEPLKASLTDPVALAAEASARLHRPVPTPAFSAKNWTIDGASFCTIAGLPSVQFHLTHDGKSVTVISMPGSAWTAYATDNYSTRSGDHAIAGYVKDGGLHCVVGDHGSSIGDVGALIRDLRMQ